MAQTVRAPGTYRSFLPDEEPCFSSGLLLTTCGVGRDLAAVGSAEPVHFVQHGPGRHRFRYCPPGQCKSALMADALDGPSLYTECTEKFRREDVLLEMQLSAVETRMADATVFCNRITHVGEDPSPTHWLCWM